MRARVDDALCRGHGVCEAVCPDVFWVTDDGYAEAQEGDVAPEHEDGVREAAQACPEHAITVS